MKKQQQIRRAILALVAPLCMTPATLAEDDTTRFVNVVVVNNEAWRSDLAIVADEGEANVRFSDCISFGGNLVTAKLQRGEGTLVPNITDYQCSGTRLGVIKLRVNAGNPRVWTQASYRDSLGNRNVVFLPTLPDALPRSYTNGTSGFSAEYVFDGIENASALGKSTFIALIPEGVGKTQVELRAFNYWDPSAAVTETVTIDGFTFYELKTPVEFGRLVVRHVAPPDSDAEPRLFAVAFVGDREAGSPRVEVPHAQFTVFTD